MFQIWRYKYRNYYQFHILQYKIKNIITNILFFSKGYLNGTVESSPLRLRSTTDVDYDDLVSRIPAMPKLPADNQSEKVSSETTVTSPVLNIVKEKADESKETSVNEADSTVDSSDAEGNSDSGEETENSCGIVLKRSAIVKQCMPLSYIRVPLYTNVFI